MKTTHLVAAVALGIATQTAFAAPTMSLAAPPAEIATPLPSAQLRGRGTLRFFGLPVYEARLWTVAGFEPERYHSHAFGLELQYARKLDGPAIAERSIAEMRRVGSFSEAQSRQWLEAMTRAFPSVQADDRLTGLYAPGEATRFYFNGRPTATVNDPEFGRLFFGIWLAAKTSSPALRLSLLGTGP